MRYCIHVSANLNPLYLLLKKNNLMKKIILFITILISASGIAFSQGVKPAIKSAVPNSVLKNARDSASYAMGIFVINFFREQGITNMNSSIVAKAINDLQSKKKPLITDEQANIAIFNYQNALARVKSKPNIDAGNIFLAANKKKQGVKTTPSGLQFEILTAGTGTLPVNGDSVSCIYRGYYINQTEFDNSNGKAITFSINGVVQGWTEALLMMPVGSKWRLYVPYYSGYGPSDYGNIPGGSTLIFEMELTGIKGK